MWKLNKATTTTPLASLLPRFAGGFVQPVKNKVLQGNGKKGANDFAPVISPPPYANLDFASYFFGGSQ
jgi:hypothetical protein